MGLIALIQWTISLMRLRATPADAPASVWLLMQLLLLDLVSSVFYLQATNQAFTAYDLLGRLSVRLVLVYGLIWLFGQQRRFMQTAIAMYATSAAITFIAMPIAAGLSRTPTQSMDMATEALLLGHISLLCWSVLIDAHILRHTLEIKLWWAIGLAFGLFVVYLQIAAQLFAGQ